MVKLSDVISASFEILKESVSKPRMEAELLAAHVLKKDRIYITVHKNDFLTLENAEEIYRISRLRADGMPFAYITGKKEFMSLEFCVNSDVLIPRPETEELVGLVIDLCKNRDVKILDLCTGSGAITISCAYYLPQSVCHGVDISDGAVQIAKLNASNLGLENRVSFWKHDVLCPQWNRGLYDVVISNPPYIETKTVTELDKTVRSFEPHLALDGGDDGLTFYKKIAETAGMYLKKGGIILFEIGYNQGMAVAEIMKDKFKDIKVIKDYSGNDRIVYGVLC